MPEKLDDIDFDLLEQVNQNPGQPLSAAVQSLESKLSRRALYDRLFALEAQQFISVDRKSKRRDALATITATGKNAIKGRMESRPDQEARSS